MNKRLKEERLGKEKLNYQGCLMKIIEYNSSQNIIVEFQDKYRYKKASAWKEFCNGNIKNIYYPSVCNVGIVGNKYPIYMNNKNIKEYNIWHTMLYRCFDEKFKKIKPTYKDVICCEEWLLYENFYEWLHEQENFNKWYNLEYSALDKDILVKGNKIYSPDTCCLVPKNINSLFTKRDSKRGDLPIGVSYNKENNNYRSYYMAYSKLNNTGSYKTPEEAFYLGYKPYKEQLIKQIAKEEYYKGNIAKRCYDAMMNYQVEITD